VESSEPRKQDEGFLDRRATTVRADNKNGQPRGFPFRPNGKLRPDDEDVRGASPNGTGTIKKRRFRGASPIFFESAANPRAGRTPSLTDVVWFGNRTPGFASRSGADKELTDRRRGKRRIKIREENGLPNQNRCVRRLCAGGVHRNRLFSANDRERESPGAAS